MSTGNVNSLVALLKSGSISKGELLAKMSSGGKPPGPPPRPQQKAQDQVPHSPARNPSNPELYPPEPTTPEEEEPFEEDEEDAQRRDSFDDLDDELPLPPLAEVSQESDLSSRVVSGAQACANAQSAASNTGPESTSSNSQAQRTPLHHSMQAYDSSRHPQATHAATAEAAAQAAALVADAALSAPMTGTTQKEAVGTVSGFSGAERQSMISTILQHKASPEAHSRRDHGSEAIQPPPTWSSTEAEEWNGPPQGLRAVPVDEPTSSSSLSQKQHAPSSTNRKPNAHSFANNGSSSNNGNAGGLGSFAAPTVAWSARAVPLEPAPPSLRQHTGAPVSPRPPRGSSGGGNNMSFDRGGGLPATNNTSASSASSGNDAFDHLPHNHHEDSGRDGGVNGLSIDTTFEGGSGPDSARSSAEGMSLRRRGSNPGVHGPERLYSQAGAIAEKKRAFVERLKAEEESRYREACTFTPNIPKSSVKLAKTVKAVLQGPPAAQPPPKSVVVPASGLGFHFAAPTAAWAHSRAPLAPPDDPPTAPPSAYRDKREQRRAAHQQQQQAQQAQESSWHLQPASSSPIRRPGAGGAGNAQLPQAPPPPSNQPSTSSSLPERFAAADVFSDEAAPFAPDQWSNHNAGNIDGSSSAATGPHSAPPPAPSQQQQQQHNRGGAPRASSSSSTSLAAKATARAHDDERDGWLRAAMQQAHGNGDSSMAWAKAQATELAGHCTFTPTTNKINPNAMPTASRYVESPVVERLTRNTQGPPPKSRLQRAHGGIPSSDAHTHGGSGVGPGEASDLLRMPAPQHHASEHKRGGPPPSFMFGRTYHRPDPNQHAPNQPQNSSSQVHGAPAGSFSNHHGSGNRAQAADGSSNHNPPVARKFGPFAAQYPPSLQQQPHQPHTSQAGSNHRELLNASDVSTSLLDAYPGSYPGTPPLPDDSYASSTPRDDNSDDVSREAPPEGGNNDGGDEEGQAPTAPTQETTLTAAAAAATAAGAAVPFAPTRAFHEMMTRQAQHLARSAENTRRLAQQATPSFQPSINAKSSHLVAESGRGSFEQRLAVDVLERHGSHSRASQERGPSSQSRSRNNSHHSAYGAWPANDLKNNGYGQPSFEQQLQQGYYYDEQHSESGYGRGSGSSLLYDYPEPPSQAMSIGQVMKLAAQNGGASLSSDRGASNQHTPAITAKAAALRARSFGEMSLGDARKREAAVRKAMARAAEDEERTFTGRPRLTAKAVQGESKLRLGSAEDAATYAQRIAHAAAQRQAKLDLLKAQALEKEEAGCTFEPLVRACPSKVARMANAHRARQQKASAQGGSRSGGSNGRPRPDWK